MNYVCPYCDEELELVEVETYEDYPGSAKLTEFNTYQCPRCGRTFQNEVRYRFVEETELKEIN